jgi:hypothetical protein
MIVAIAKIAFFNQRHGNRSLFSSLNAVSAAAGQPRA